MVELTPRSANHPVLNLPPVSLFLYLAMSPTVRAPATLLFVLAVALLLVASPALALPGLPRVQEGSFAELKNAAREQVVVFYRSSNAAHQNALTVRCDRVY